MKVSVIVPVYNVEAYLRACLDSVLAQTLGDFELVCVDDGSTDGSPAILDAYARKDARVRIVRRANGGLSAARNSGLEVAVGEYVYFLDGDDCLRRDALERLCALADRERLDQVVFSTDLDVEPGAASDARIADMRRYYSVPEDLAGRTMSGAELFAALVARSAFFASVPLRLLRRSALPADLRFPEGLLHEDNFFTPLALLAAARAQVVSDPLYVRRVRGGSIMMSAGLERRHAEGFFRVHGELGRRFRFAPGGTALRAACDAYLAELWRLYAACGVDVRAVADEGRVGTVSVVIPVYNAGAALAPCLESVLAQTYRDLEVVCVDDGSTDGSADVLADFAARDRRLRVVRHAHADAGTARNAGYAETSGGALLFLDADDVFAPDMVATLVRGLEDGRTEIAVCGWEDFEDGSPVPPPDAGDDVWEVVDDPAQAADVYDRWMGWAWDKLVRRSLIEREGLRFQAVRSSNDLAFTFAALVSARRVSQTRRRLVAHRKSVRTVSATRDRDPLCFAAALREHHAFLSRKGLMAPGSFLARDFRRYALVFSYWHLDTMGTDEGYGMVFSELRRLFAELGVEAAPDAADAVWTRYRRLGAHGTPVAYLRAEVSRLEGAAADLRRERDALAGERDGLRDERDWARASLAAMESSLSFRLGRMATSPLRVARRVFRFLGFCRH